VSALLRKPWVAAPAVLLLVVLTVAACGSDKKPAESPTPVQSETPASQPAAAVYDLSAQTPPFVAYGADAGDFTHGFSSVDAGDFNGDDAPDLLIGAPFADGPGNAREDSGEAYVIFGQPQLSGRVDLAEGEQDVTVFGAAAGDNLGLSVVAADVNGDGLDDIIVGAPGVSDVGGRDERTDQGRTYVFFGSQDLAESFDLGADAEAFDFVITGAEGFSRIGHALAKGDVNGDAVTDLILGAPFAGREPGSPPGSPRKEAGEVYVVYGSSSLSGELHIAFDPVGFMASSEQRHGQFGAAVAAGDLNGDGIDDVIAGAPQMDFEDRETAGAVYVFFGGRDLGGRRFIAEGEQDAAMIGAERGHSLGFPLSAGDINGDGAGDLIAGARSAVVEETRTAAGAVYLLFGGPGLGGDHDLAQTPPDSVIYGAGAGDLLPAALLAFDVIGDSARDIIVSTSSGPEQRVQAGAVYIIAGSAALPSAVDLAAAGTGASIVGAEVGDRLGSALAVLSLQAGGPPAFVLLASGADGPDNAREDAGEVYVVPAAETSGR